MKPAALLVSILLSGAFAQAKGPGSHDPLPHCFANFKNAKNLVLDWDARKLDARPIWAFLSSEPCFSFKTERDAHEHRALNWRATRIDRDSGSLAGSIATSVFGVSFSPEQRELLMQIRFGATVRRDLLSAHDFVNAQAITDYSFELNRELSARYGVGFAGDVYQAVIERKEKNRAAKANFTPAFRFALSNPDAARESLARESAGTKLLVSYGLGWESDPSAFDSSTPRWVTDFTNEMTSTGIPAKLLQRNRLGTVRENVESLKPQIRAELLNHNRVILVGLCKGVVEMLLAWTEIEAEWAATGGRPASAGRVVGVLNLSGMNHGTYLADTLEQSALSSLLKFLVEYVPLGGRAERKGYPRALETLTVAAIDQINSYSFPHLDREAAYLNVVGVIGGSGRIPGQALMNDFYRLNSTLKLLPAAHDGFIEYPGNEIPEAFTPRSATIAIQTSHMLSDGLVEGEPTSESRVRLAMYQAFLHVLLEMKK